MTERHHDSDKAQQQGKLYFYYIFYKLPGAPFFRPSFLDFIKQVTRMVFYYLGQNLRKCTTMEW